MALPDPSQVLTLVSSTFINPRSAFLSGCEHVTKGNRTLLWDMLTGPSCQRRHLSSPSRMYPGILLRQTYNEPFSLGATAIFLIGGKTRDVQPIPILLRSGDVVIMSGPHCRRVYHGKLIVSCFKYLYQCVSKACLVSWRARYHSTLPLEATMIGLHMANTWRMELG